MGNSKRAMTLRFSIFAGSQTGTSTILLNGAAPSLAALVFSNTANRYVLDQGSGGSRRERLASTVIACLADSGRIHRLPAES